MVFCELKSSSQDLVTGAIINMMLFNSMHSFPDLGEKAWKATKCNRCITDIRDFYPVIYESIEVLSIRTYHMYHLKQHVAGPQHLYTPVQLKVETHITFVKWFKLSESCTLKYAHHLSFYWNWEHMQFIWQMGRLGMADIRRIYGEHQRTYGAHTADIRLI